MSCGSEVLVIRYKTTRLLLFIIHKIVEIFSTYKSYLKIVSKALFKLFLLLRLIISILFLIYFVGNFFFDVIFNYFFFCKIFIFICFFLFKLNFSKWERIERKKKLARTSATNQQVMCCLWNMALICCQWNISMDLITNQQLVTKKKNIYK